MDRVQRPRRLSTRPSSRELRQPLGLAGVMLLNQDWYDAAPRSDQGTITARPTTRCRGSGKGKPRRWRQHRALIDSRVALPVDVREGSHTTSAAMHLNRQFDQLTGVLHHHLLLDRGADIGNGFVRNAKVLRDSIQVLALGEEAHDVELAR